MIKPIIFVGSAVLTYNILNDTRNSYRKPEEKTFREVKKAVNEEIVDYYTSWRRRREYDRHAREPRITAASLHDFFNQSAMPEDYRFQPKRVQLNMINRSIRQLEKEGKIRFSLGQSPFRESGREVKLWEPTNKNSLGYPGRPVKVSDSMAKEFKIKRRAKMPDWVAARYVPATDTILVPEDKISDQLLQHEQVHRDWELVYPTKLKREWKRIIRGHPKLREELWKDYNGPGDPDDEEILADIISQLEVGKKMRLPADVRRLAKKLMNMEAIPDPRFSR